MLKLDREYYILQLGKILILTLESRGQENKLEINEQTKLFGSDGCLDSMGLVMFIMDVEQWVKDYTNESIVLADSKAMSQKNSPFLSIGSMVDFIFQLLHKKE